MIFSSPAPQCGQCCRSMSKTRLSSRSQPIRCGRAATVSASPPAAAAASLACPATSATLGPCPCGTTRARSLAFGASTPWNRMRCSRGRGTGARRAPFGRPGGQPLHELQRTHHPVRGAIAPRGLELHQLKRNHRLSLIFHFCCPLLYFSLDLIFLTHRCSN